MKHGSDISKRLVGVVPKATLYRWAEKELPLEAKKSTKPRSKKILKWESSEDERSLPQKQLEHKEQDQGRPGKWNQAPEAYDINQREVYDAEYLRDVVKYQHDKDSRRRKSRSG